MNILYVSTLCSEQRFNELFDLSNVKPQQQAQKFHNLLSKGLVASNCDINVLSRPPITKSTRLIRKLFKKKEKYNNISYFYLKISRIPLIRNIILFISSFLYTLKWIVRHRKEEKIIISDVLNLSITFPALFLSKLFKVKNLAIVTDLPNFLIINNKQKSFYESTIRMLSKKIGNYLINRYDLYVMLTHQMNEIINIKRKPYLVIEGLVDAEIQPGHNSLEGKLERRVLLYAGSLHEKYGVKNLILAFSKLEFSDVELWLFGYGDTIELINDYQNIDSRIKYFGVRTNSFVLEQEVKATLLINPRSSNEEFTKYSFPSKNMEYMASGTPVVTSKLPGMSSEYYPYVYLFDDETIDGMANSLNIILSNSRLSLHEMGKKAQDFVLTKKSYVVQAQKIINLIMPD